jgi:hypothetical protein
MSSYSNITPRIFDSVFDRSNLRAEYRLPAGQVYLSTMRLANVGFTSTGASSYNKLLGAYGAIRQISLFDGSQLLEQVKLAPQVLAFKNAKQRNDESISMNRKLKHSATGYVTSGRFTVDGATHQIKADDIKVREQEDEANSTGEDGWLSLKDVFSFLDRSLIVPTGVFTQFRVVVEYNDSAALAKLCSTNNLAPYATKTTGLLLVDEVNEGETRDLMMKNYQGVVYRPLELDTVIVPAITGLADTAADKSKKQDQSFLINGFINKRVVRVALIQEPTDATTYENGNTVTGFGAVASQAQFAPQVQLRVNGANKLAARGISSESGHSSANRALAYLSDTWGEFTMVSGQQSLDSHGYASYVADDSLKGTQQYLGLAVDERINELQLQYSRTGHVSSTQTSQQLRLHVMGEVERAVILGQGGYNVVYA